MSDEEESVEPSLDQLSQAFAAAMGRGTGDSPESDSGDASGSRDASEASAEDTASSESADGADSVAEDSVDPDDACPISPKSVFEAILFVGHPENQPIAGPKIAKLLRGVDVEELPDLVTELNDDYVRHEMPYRVLAEPVAPSEPVAEEPMASENSEVEAATPEDEANKEAANKDATADDKETTDETSADVAETPESETKVVKKKVKATKSKLAPVIGYRLTLRDEFVHLRENFYGRVREAQLSQLAVDVLAVVAYNQPITREAINRTLDTGLDTGRVLNQLVRRNLLQRQTKDDAAKTRGKEYVTTSRFLELFNLQDIGDLPRTDDP